MEHIIIQMSKKLREKDQLIKDTQRQTSHDKEALKELHETVRQLKNKQLLGDPKLAFKNAK